MPETSMTAKIRSAVEREVPAAPEAVYDKLSKVHLYGDWWPREVAFEIDIPEPVGAGSRFIMQALGARFAVEVARVQPGKGLWMRFTGGPYAGTWEWILEPAPRGTRVVYQLRAEPVGRWFKVLSRLIDLGRLHTVWAERALIRLG